MIAIYTKDIDTDQITYHGEQDWDSRKQLLEHFGLADERAETESMMGWPHAQVTWHGRIGFGEINA